VLDNSNYYFFNISKFKNKSYIFLKSIKISKESISIAIYRSIFKELIEVEFNLVLSVSIKEYNSEEGLLFLYYRSKEEVYLDLVELVLKLLIIPLV
jgi:hypothetical protein